MRFAVAALAAVTWTVVGSAQAAALLSPPTAIEQQVMTEAPSFTFSLEAVALWRWNDDALLAVHANTDATFGTEAFEQTVAPGAKFAVGATLGDGWGLEFGGLLVSSQTDAVRFVDPTERMLSVYTQDYNLANLRFPNSESFGIIEAERDWSLLGLDASMSFALGDGFKVTAGPAWLRYANSLHTTVYDEARTPDDYIDYVNIDTTNDLLGGKIGIEGMADITDAISFGGKAAVGVYYAAKGVYRSYQGIDTTGVLSAFADGDFVEDSYTDGGVATSIELSPKLAVALSPELSFTFGGTVLLLNGVDEAAGHYADVGFDDGSGGLARDSANFSGVKFGGVTAGLSGQF